MRNGLFSRPLLPAMDIDHGGRFFKQFGQSSRSASFNASMLNNASDDQAWSNMDIWNQRFESNTSEKLADNTSRCTHAFCNTRYQDNCRNHSTFHYPEMKSCDLDYWDNASTNGIYDGIGSFPLRADGTRAIRAGPIFEKCRSFDQESPLEGSLSRSTDSTSPARDSRSSSPNSDTSCSIPEKSITNWMSNLNLGTSVSPPKFLSSAFRHLTEARLPVVTPFLGDKRWQLFPPHEYCNEYLKRAIKRHRNAARYYEAKYTWSGTLPYKEVKNPTYSTKVFLGGVPYEMTEASLKEFFSKFGVVEVECPNGDEETGEKKKGYAYIILETEKCVRSLLAACESRGGKYYVKLPTRRREDKDVQVIPWIQANSHYSKDHSSRIDTTKLVFVGNVHGMMTAEHIATIMNEVFGGVSYVGIDIDKNKYPIGSSRLSFDNVNSYKMALDAAFINAKCGRVSKRLQIDPYLQTVSCSVCGVVQGPVFCRDKSCSRYFCSSCWLFAHCFSEETIDHRVCVRKRRDS